MGLLDARADLFFDVCKKSVNQTFGDGVRLQKSANPARMTTVLGVAPGGGDIRCFNAGEKTWDSMEDDDIHVGMTSEGRVSVGYSQEDNIDYSMSFKVGHPCEVAELLHLFINPAVYLAEEETYSGRECGLGEIFDFYVLVPDGQQWRMLNPAALPPDTPDEFRKAFYCNLNREWDNFVAGKTFEAFKFEQRWPEFVKSLPDAADALRAGYILSPEGDLFSAVDLAVIPPSGKSLFFDMLVVPSKADVSAMYVRELINGDKKICQEIRKAFRPAAELETFMAAIKSTKISLPGNIQTQIRIAAEHNAVRLWLLNVSERLATQRDYFNALPERHWHLAHSLAFLLDRSED